jgi:glutamate synthase (NADH)
MYLLRKLIEARLRKVGVADDECYFCSLSTRTLVYKGQLTPQQVRVYFKDLQREDFK